MKVNLAYQQPFLLEVLVIDGVFISSEVNIPLCSTDFKAHILPTTQYCKECDPLALYLKNHCKLSTRGCEDGIVEMLISLKSTDTKFLVRLEGDPLEKLQGLFEEDVWLKVEICDVYVDGRRLTPVTSRKMNIQMEENAYYAQGLMQCPTDWRKLWLSRGEGLSIGGKVSIQLCSDKIQKTIAKSVDGNYEQMLNTSKKMLHEQIATDVQVIAGNSPNPVVGCHRGFLLAHSSKFPLSCTRGWYTISFEEMSETGVKALLKFIYYRDLDDAKNNPGIAAELTRCAAKYQIESLDKAMKDLKL